MNMVDSIIKIGNVLSEFRFKVNGGKATPSMSVLPLDSLGVHVDPFLKGFFVQHWSLVTHRLRNEHTGFVF